MKTLIKLLALIALTTIFCTAETPSDVQAVRIDKPLTGFLSFQLEPNPTVILGSQPFNDEEKQKTVDFLLGFFVDITMFNTIVDHDEWTECIQPDDEFHNQTQALIASASYVATHCDYSDFKSGIIKPLMPFAYKFVMTLIKNCPSSQATADALFDYFNRIVIDIDSRLSDNWNYYRYFVTIYFGTFKKAIDENQYKHAMALSLIALHELK